jgi:hypothetical protein
MRPYASRQAWAEVSEKEVIDGNQAFIDKLEALGLITTQNGQSVINIKAGCSPLQNLQINNVNFSGQPKIPAIIGNGQLKFVGCDFNDCSFVSTDKTQNQAICNRVVFQNSTFNNTFVPSGNQSGFVQCDANQIISSERISSLIANRSQPQIVQQRQQAAEIGGY